MKKLYVLGLSLIGLGSINAQTYHTKDFEDGSLTSGGWTTQVVVDTTNWKVATFGTPVETFAKISNYNNGNVAAEAWLISPAIDLSSSTNPVVSFESKMKFNGPALEIKVSVDYDGTSAPSTATWTDVTAGATLDTDASTWGPWVNSGEIDLSSYQNNSVYIAFRYTGSATDGSTWEVDNILVAEAGTNGGGNGGNNTAVLKTIYDIQFTNDPAGDSPLKDSMVMTYGIVTAVNIFQGTQKGYYIQDGVGAWNGIYVFDNNNIVQRGDSVMVRGMVDEYFNSTQLTSVDSVAIISSFNDVPATILTTAGVADEMYESVLCQVQNANCTALPNNFNEWMVNDGSGDIAVDDFLFAYTPTLNTTYNVTGVVAYAFGAWKMYPRDANDISFSTSIGENTAKEFTVYPNPAVDVINVIASENESMLIYNMIGKVVKSQLLTNVSNTIDVSDLPAGNYIIRIADKSQLLTIK